MKRRTAVLAGTALGLLMAASPMHASPLAAGDADRSGLLDRTIAPGDTPRVILAQNEGQGAPEEEQPQAAEEAPAEEAPAPQAEQPAEQAPAEQQAQPEPAPAPEPAAEPAPAQAEQPAEQAPAEQQAQPEPAPAPEPAPESAPAQAEQPAGEAPAEQQAQPEQETAPTPQEAPAQAEQPAGEAPAEQQAQPEQETAPTPQEAPAQAEQPAGEAPAEQQAQPEQETAPTPQEAPAQAEQPAGEAPAEQQAQPDGQAPAPGAAAETQPGEGEAPLLDSQKERQARPGRNAGRDGQPAADGQQPAQGEQQAQPAPAAPAGPPPESDAAAQQSIQAEEMQPVTAEEGQRVEFGTTRDERRASRRERRERRDNTEVVRQFDDNRTIVEFNNQVFIESPDYERIILDNDDVYYEELPRGRTREVITRGDGTRVVTVRNRYGDVIRRSRIQPDNREVVLVYVEDRYYDDVQEWRDPAQDLPPLRLTIPREEYILEAELVEDQDAYYTFFDQPPVENVTRTYSIDEVKRSARVRDIVRRVDLDTINFEFGSASVAEAEIDKLADVAGAMERMLSENPAETFLIEGHTDAVGSDLANLALSDQRAESVARALTSVFGIPPENLATQGYGEQYLKIATEERERENRRVAIRRITPLVAPVAQAN